MVVLILLLNVRVGTIYQMKNSKTKFWLASFPSSSFAAMGKAQKKTGKGRLDKYYKLAKLVPLITSTFFHLTC